MELKIIESIVQEELSEAELRIMRRLSEISSIQRDSKSKIKPLPDNPKYAQALAIYNNELNHSKVARELDVSINAAKKYYTWLVKNGYLPIEDAELSEAEKKVVKCLYEQEMSLREAAQSLNCSVTNVVYRRDSALRKGYKETHHKEIDAKAQPNLS